MLRTFQSAEEAIGVVGVVLAAMAAETSGIFSGA
jgi:hypothetical protein